MSEEEKKAIKEVKHFNKLARYWQEEEYEEKEIAEYITTILNLIEKQQKELDIIKCNYEILKGEMDRIGIDTLGLEPGNSTDDVIEEIKKKDKIIDEMSKYINNLDIDEDICRHFGKDEKCNDYTDEDKCKKCIIDYFTKKVDEQNG